MDNEIKINDNIRITNLNSLERYEGRVREVLSENFLIVCTVDVIHNENIFKVQRFHNHWIIVEAGMGGY